MMTGFISSLGPAALDHLWQSTAFVAAVWVVTLALKSNAARVRYGLWLAASMKFLVPFSVLMGLGSLLPKMQVANAAMPLYPAMDLVGMPFVEMRIAKQQHVGWHEWGATWLPMLLAAVWLCGIVTVVAIWVVLWWRIAAVVRKAEVVTSGRDWEALWRADGDRKVRLVKTRSLMEPGIFGVWRPQLMWPEGLSERLEDEHIEAIVAHELMHVRRRDNLTAMLHMAVTALFWFHPAVWWMERRMVEERERACDEGVIAMGGRRGAYAEGLLKAVRFCVESPLACVAGISGADLNRRVRAIMTMQLDRLSALQKVMLGVAGIALVGVPVVFGQMHAMEARTMLDLLTPMLLPPPPPLASKWEIAAARSLGTLGFSDDEKAFLAQTVLDASKKPVFEIISIRQNKSGNDGDRMAYTADGFIATNIPLQTVIVSAYRVRNADLMSGTHRIPGAPSWIQSDRYDIQAKMSDSEIVEFKKLRPDQQEEQKRLLLQSMLADRFRLTLHYETKEAPVYMLVVAKNGPKMKKEPDDAVTQYTQSDRTHINYHAVPMSDLVARLTSLTGQPVLDKTGLTGKYDCMVQWAPGPESGLQGAAASIDSDGPSLFTALEEQLGLKLEPAKGEVETPVIDQIERPSEN